MVHWSLKRTLFKGGDPSQVAYTGAHLLGASKRQSQKETMEDEFGETFGDVTIHLVEKPGTSWTSREQAGSSSGKRKRSSMEPESEDGFHLGKVKADSGRLRRCSKYFETGLSERWAQSKRPSLRMEFYLEAQTDVVYYKDCFSRMHFLFKPIPSVAYCIELLKVASQIAFQAVLGLGVKYLSAAVWSAGEEKLIREFYEAGHLSFASASDLSARLDELPLADEDQQIKLSQCAQGMLSRYLRHAIPNDSTPGPKSREEAVRTCPDSSIKFAGALHTIMSGMCKDDVLQSALSLVKEETERLLGSITNLLHYEGAANASFQRDIQNLCWLFKVSRRVNAAQAIVDAIVKDTAFSNEMKDADTYIPIPDDILKKWTQVVIGPIFQDVLEGSIFLDSLQRITLFSNWCWILRFLDLDEARVAEFVTRFTMTLPQREQEKFWMSAVLDRDCGPSTEVHNSWIRSLVSLTAPGSQFPVIPCDDTLCEFPV